MWLLVAVIAAVVLGVLSARAVVKPIRTLHSGATALRQGDFAHRVTGAERGDMAAAFNGMAEENQRWNRELGERVEEKTRELNQAQTLDISSTGMYIVTGEPLALGSRVVIEVFDSTGVLATPLVAEGEVVRCVMVAPDPDARSGLGVRVLERPDGAFDALARRLQEQHERKST